MRPLIVSAFVFSSLLAAPGIIVAPANAQVYCGPDAPAAYLRPGGYCSQMNPGRSLSVPVDPGCDTYKYVYPASGDVRPSSGEPTRVRVAVTCEVDCSIERIETGFELLREGDRLHLAQPAPPEGCDFG